MLKYLFHFQIATVAKIDKTSRKKMNDLILIAVTHFSLFLGFVKVLKYLFHFQIAPVATIDTTSRKKMKDLILISVTHLSLL